MEKGVPIRAISRGLAVLQAVNKHGGLTMMEIAQLSEVPYPTACRIVQTLLHEGMLEREAGRKRYRATASVLTLSSGFVSPTYLQRQPVHNEIRAAGV
jgi:IclR family transcriptional regulator, mhp operon transcriptional activator